MKIGGVYILFAAFVTIQGPGALFAQGALPKKIPTPANNPMSLAKIELGKKLFFDPRFSSSGTVSCNSCHNVMAAGEDGLAVSVGVGGQKGGRSSPTVWNAAFYSSMFWDGRAASLEEQAKGPLTNPIEMGMKDHDAVMARVRAIPGYEEQFKKAFPGEKNPLTIDHFAKAIATYERTLVTYNSPYDRYLKGQKNALSKDALSGLGLVSEVGCTSCHSGPRFSGPELPAGVGFFQKFPVYAGSSYEKRYDLTADLGRFNVTQDENDKNTWRVPTWRNIAVTAPYFHNGRVGDLAEAVRVMAKMQLNKDLQADEVKQIVRFLEALTGEFPEQKMPRLSTKAGEPAISVQ